MESFNNIVKGVYGSLWSSCSTLVSVLSGPSDLVGSSVLSLLNTAAQVMSTSGRHAPSELLA